MQEVSNIEDLDEFIELKNENERLSLEIDDLKDSLDQIERSLAEWKFAAEEAVQAIEEYKDAMNRIYDIASSSV